MNLHSTVCTPLQKFPSAIPPLGMSESLNHHSYISIISASFSMTHIQKDISWQCMYFSQKAGIWTMMYLFLTRKAVNNHSVLPEDYTHIPRVTFITSSKLDIIILRHSEGNMRAHSPGKFPGTYPIWYVLDSMPNFRVGKAVLFVPVVGFSRVVSRQTLISSVILYVLL